MSPGLEDGVFLLVAFDLDLGVEGCCGGAGVAFGGGSVSDACFLTSSIVVSAAPKKAGAPSSEEATRSTFLGLPALRLTAGGRTVDDSVSAASASCSADCLLCTLTGVVVGLFPCERRVRDFKTSVSTAGDAFAGSLSAGSALLEANPSDLSTGLRAVRIDRRLPFRSVGLSCASLGTETDTVCGFSQVDKTSSTFSVELTTASDFRLVAIALRGNKFSSSEKA